MRFRTRCFCALACLALFAAIPGPDAATGNGAMALRRVRAWLLAEPSPLSALVHEGALPPLVVDLRQSPPIVDPEEARRRAAEYSRCAEEWAAERTVRIDPARGFAPLLVRVGERGMQAELPAAPGGAPAVLVAPLPSRWSLLPMVVAIVTALLTNRGLVALLLAAFAGAIVHVATAVPGASVSVTRALAGGVDHFVLGTIWQRLLADGLGLRLLLFACLVTMAASAITRNGGWPAFLGWLRRRGTGPVRAQFAVVAAGIGAVLGERSHGRDVGEALRPATDAAGMPREKLAFLVAAASTAIGGLVVGSTWLVWTVAAYDVPLGAGGHAVAVFGDVLAYRCYCLLLLVLVGLGIALRRELGPMVRAVPHVPEAAGTHPPIDATAGAHRFVMPLLLLVAGSIVALLAGLDGDVALPLAAAAACAAALLLSPAKAPAAALAGVRQLWLPVALVLAITTFAHISKDLGTGTWLFAAIPTSLGSSIATGLPLLLFVFAGAIAITTGSSLLAIAALLPNVVVLTLDLGNDGRSAALLMLVSLTAVLEGAYVGAQSSPGSDTTQHSAAGAQCNVAVHVATQRPYTWLVFVVSAICSYLPLARFVGFVPTSGPWSLGAGVVALTLVLLIFGRRPSG
jgi:tetracycline resistance efflux pump